MLDTRHFLRLLRRASLLCASTCLLGCAPLPSSVFASAPGSELAGAWDIVDHTLDDGSNYHIYLELHPAEAGLTGHVSYPWGYLPIASSRLAGSHFQLFGEAGQLLVEGDRTGGKQGPELHLHLALGRQADQPRIATWLSTEPLPRKLPYPELHPVAATGAAPTPPMGWNSWNNFEEKIDDPTIRRIADAMATNGMRDAGYTYLNIDDTWEGPRDAQGNITANRKFPDMKALADYVHGRGLKLGIYSSPGPLTCAGYPGSLGHEEQDARTYAAWGIDYLKYDWCSARKIYQPAEMHAVYQKMGDALAHTGRPILFSLCQYGEDNVWTWGPRVGATLWRTTEDIHDSWTSMSSIGFAQSRLAPFAGPGHWNDPDMLEVGNGHMSTGEYRTHFSLWAMLAAPLLAGNDVTQMDGATRGILLNKEVIAVDQDPAGRQATLLARSGDRETWSKQLANGDVAVGLFNRGPAPAPFGVQLAALGLTGSVAARDLWLHTPITIAGDVYTATVPAHGVVLLRLHAGKAS
ncbi:alpha-galactosidase [Granulicella rosea]|uniref:Alpha-galactosidase n=1 Tax=Granulicella rosea TaxID=474952 RepID=A0A239LWW1_9BACT|nr:glycoside hydrolase family 27 protein [Granulicella rosea]SNT34855.1 alpha-galactosidase [Granulicella rosea]